MPPLLLLIVKSISLLFFLTICRCETFFMTKAVAQDARLLRKVFAQLDRRVYGAPSARANLFLQICRRKTEKARNVDRCHKI